MEERRDLTGSHYLLENRQCKRQRQKQRSREEVPIAGRKDVLKWLNSENFLEVEG